MGKAASCRVLEFFPSPWISGSYGHKTSLPQIAVCCIDEILRFLFYQVPQPPKPPQLDQGIGDLGELWRRNEGAGEGWGHPWRALGRSYEDVEHFALAYARASATCGLRTPRLHVLLLEPFLCSLDKRADHFLDLFRHLGADKAFAGEARQHVKLAGGFSTKLDHLREVNDRHIACF